MKVFNFLLILLLIAALGISGCAKKAVETAENKTEAEVDSLKISVEDIGKSPVGSYLFHPTVKIDNKGEEIQNIQIEASVLQNNELLRKVIRVPLIKDGGEITTVVPADSVINGTLAYTSPTGLQGDYILRIDLKIGENEEVIASTDKPFSI